MRVLKGNRFESIDNIANPRIISLARYQVMCEDGLIDRKESSTGELFAILKDSKCTELEKVLAARRLLKRPIVDSNIKIITNHYLNIGDYGNDLERLLEFAPMIEQRNKVAVVLLKLKRNNASIMRSIIKSNVDFEFKRKAARNILKRPFSRVSRDFKSFDGGDIFRSHRIQRNCALNEDLCLFVEYVPEFSVKMAKLVIKGCATYKNLQYIIDNIHECSTEAESVLLRSISRQINL